MMVLAAEVHCTQTALAEPLFNHIWNKVRVVLRAFKRTSFLKVGNLLVNLLHNGGCRVRGHSTTTRKSVG
jgi:hypothetical protein